MKDGQNALPTVPSSRAQLVCPYVAGITSGIAKTVVGHPFDTIKVPQKNMVTNVSKGLSYE